MRALPLLFLALLLVGCSTGTRQESLNARKSLKLVEDGAKLLAKGNKPLALKAFDQAIADSPGNQDIYMAVIGLLIEEGMHRESMPYIEQAIALPEKNSRFPATDRIRDSGLYTTLGDASWKLGDIAAAEKAYQTAVRLNRDNATAYNNWGYMLAESNQQLDKALDLTRKAIALEPENGCFLDSVGWAYFQKGDAGRALGYLRQAVRLSPSELEVRLHYARALDAQGNVQAALVEYHKVLRLSPSNALAKERIRTLPAKNTSK